ncbi:SAM-dependent methyltransferase, MidA family [Methylobacillus rhizosphaerae]|uniref:SAM-dependent methyltransferase, MidA family n=1 Tax=Methylobacillus rhizosphaerae TaxID=551994 RepID=A0A238Z6B4_9PROT|nr:SAM-dependent methyltransferase [Methylobacillus rhizosphaerae]SNR78421.1 SAM-dependent methyltransferase, MidA family [Methylobacillus rhizosphaerae]
MNTSALPIPDADALAHSAKLLQVIHDQIAVEHWISFARYMELALYEPGLGYYSAGAQKFGEAGDFVTAPEMTPLFGQAVAQQVMEVLAQTSGDVLELGAGRGRLAVSMLEEMQRAGGLPGQYLILEVSADLRHVQQQYLESVLPPHLYAKVVWLDALPADFTGVIVANEVLDAIPVHLVRKQENKFHELGVGLDEYGDLVLQAHPLAAGSDLERALAGLDLPDGYQAEVSPAMQALVAALSACLRQGVMLLIDYGFSRAEYYHPQRDMGTLMCHYRHYAHTDAFLYPGLQDLTAHVDFSAVAETGMAHGMQLLGYCGQAQFLINCGITDLLLRVPARDVSQYAPLASQAQKLLSPAEMGELFKVIALGREVMPLSGFVRGDRSHIL